MSETNEHDWSKDLTDEQIKELKNNTTYLGSCPDWMQKAFKEMPYEITRMRGRDEDYGHFGTDATLTYYLDPAYTLPAPEPEAEEGYKIVSMEDRKRCAYPNDDEVRYMQKSREENGWRSSVGDMGWSSKSVFGGCSEDILFAVPTAYTFAEDRVQEYRDWCMNDVPPRCWLRDPEVENKASLIVYICADGVETHTAFVSWKELSKCIHSTDLKTWHPCKVAL